MSPTNNRCFLLFAILAHFATPTVGLSISLARFNNNSEIGQAIYSQETFLPGVENSIDLIDVPKNVPFAVLQVHAHEKNVSLAPSDSTECNGTRCALYGSNLGLVAFFGPNSTAKFVAVNQQDEPIEVLITVIAYDKNAPIPGGCNMEFDFKVSPFQKLQLTEATVNLQAQPASAPSGSQSFCGSPSITLRRFRMFLPERDFKQDTYFSGIENMTTVRDILKNGVEVLPALGGSSANRVFSAYPGTGSIYAVIATYGNYSSAYVSVVSYACSPLSSPSSCGDLNTKTGQALCAIVLIVGLVVTFAGHKCSWFESIFIRATSGGIIVFTILSAMGHFQSSTVLGTVMGVSFLGGFCWLALFCCTGMIGPATILASMTLGFFVASTVYFVLADDTSLFESDVNFWLIFVSIMLLLPIITSLLPFASHDVCCAILGAHAIILPLDYYAGSNLKYLFINTVRRATVSGFNVAVVRPPYQSTDKTLVAFLVIIALIGIYVRFGMSLCCCCKRENITTVFWSERQPIISSSRRGRRVLVFSATDRVEHHRFQ